jgi:hypothetical protein
MLTIIAILTVALAAMIGLKYLTKLIAASIIYQANYRDEPVAISPRDRLHRIDSAQAISIAPIASPALAPEDDAVHFPGRVSTHRG